MRVSWQSIPRISKPLWMQSTSRAVESIAGHGNRISTTPDGMAYAKVHTTGGQSLDQLSESRNAWQALAGCIERVRGPEPADNRSPPGCGGVQFITGNRNSRSRLATIGSGYSMAGDGSVVRWRDGPNYPIPNHRSSGAPYLPKTDQLIVADRGLLPVKAAFLARPIGNQSKPWSPLVTWSVFHPAKQR